MNTTIRRELKSEWGLIRMTVDFINDDVDTSGSVFQTNTFGGKIKGRANSGIVIIWTIFFLPPFVRLLEELSMSSLLEYFLSLIISDSESFTFIRGRVNPVLTYFMKPMLDSRWVESLLKFVDTLRGCRVVMMLWLPYFRVTMVNLEVI